MTLMLMTGCSMGDFGFWVFCMFALFLIAEYLFSLVKDDCKPIVEVVDEQD